MVPSLSVFIILMCIRLGFDIYVWHGVYIVFKKKNKKQKRTVAILYWTLTLLWITVFTGLYLGKLYFTTAPIKIFLVLYYLQLFAKVVWAPFILLSDISRIYYWLKRSFFANPNPIKNNQKVADENTGISRLKFLEYTGVGVTTAMTGAGLYGIAKGAHDYEIVKRDLPIHNLPSEFVGLKIVQFSDIHSGSFWNRDAVVRGVEMVNNLGADLIFFTGDLVNDFSTEFDKWQDVFSQIKAPLGVYSILGNHDYGDYHPWPDKLENIKARGDKSHMTPLQKADFEAMIQQHKKLGWDLLLNENRIIPIRGKKLAIIGVENWSAAPVFPRYGNLQKAYKGAENSDLKLLLSHDPTHWRAEVLPQFPDIAVTFSGHTHGSQIGVDTKFLRWSPVKYIYQDWIDLYTHGEQHLYVNRGFGYIGFPGRIGVRPEITLFTLFAK